MKIKDITIKKGEILRINGQLTIAHQIKAGAVGKIKWDEEMEDWTVPDPENDLSDELLVKSPSSVPGIADPLFSIRGKSWRGNEVS